MQLTCKIHINKYTHTHIYIYIYEVSLCVCVYIYDFGRETSQKEATSFSNFLFVIMARDTGSTVCHESDKF